MPKPQLTTFNGKVEWFEEAAKNGLDHLLSFADDQVVMGWVENNKLTTTASINIAKLQRVHVFGEKGELRLLHTKNGFEEVWLDEDGFASEDMEDENYPLWNEGEQGLSFTPPSQISAIKVRQYIRYDDQGQAYFSHGRLVSFLGGAK